MADVAALDRKALLRQRFATLAAEVDTGSPAAKGIELGVAAPSTTQSPPPRTTSDFIAEALASAAAQRDHPLSINGGDAPSAVLVSTTPERSRVGEEGAAARHADWAALTDTLAAMRQHSDFEACLLDPSFAEAGGLRSIIEAFATLPWAAAHPAQQHQQPDAAKSKDEGLGGDTDAAAAAPALTQFAARLHPVLYLTRDIIPTYLGSLLQAMTPDAARVLIGSWP